MRLKMAIAALVACFVLALPGFALAASPTEDAYSGVLPAQTQGGNNSNGPGAGTEAAVVATEPTVSAAEVESVGGGNTLPFTGLEVGLIALVGVVLVGGGVVLYRLNRTAAPRSS